MTEERAYVQYGRKGDSTGMRWQPQPRSEQTPIHTVWTIFRFCVERAERTIIPV